jgi:hypothetical protein
MDAWADENISTFTGNRKTTIQYVAIHWFAAAISESWDGDFINIRYIARELKLNA